MHTLRRTWPCLVLLALLTVSQGFSGAAHPPQTAPATPPVRLPQGNLYVLTFIDVLPQYTEGTEAVCRKYIAASRNDPGLLRFEALEQTAGRPNHLMLLAVWKTEKDFQTHEGKAYTKKFREQLLPYLGAPFDERLSYVIPPN